MRTFPDLVGGILLKGAERRNTVKLEQVKDELSRNTQSEIERLRADYSTLKSSTDYLSANQAELRSKMITSTERLWSNMLEIQKAQADVIFMEKIALPSELEDAFARRKWPRLLELLKEYKNQQHVTSKLFQCEKEWMNKERLFVGDRLWLIYLSLKLSISESAFWHKDHLSKRDIMMSVTTT